MSGFHRDDEENYRKQAMIAAEDLRYELLAYCQNPKPMYELVSHECETLLERDVMKAIEARGNSQLLGNAINEYPFIVIFHYDNRKKEFIYSLFKNANSDVNILSIATEYGGGGHVCACGFTSDQRLVIPAR